MNRIQREIQKKEKLLAEKQETAFISRVYNIFQPSVFGLENSLKAIKNYLSERLTNLGEGIQENNKTIIAKLESINSDIKEDKTIKIEEQIKELKEEIKILDNSKSIIEQVDQLAEIIKKKDFRGKDGKDGVNGKDGTNGYTPKKGVDYYTGEDISELIRTIISQIPTPKDGVDGSPDTPQGIKNKLESLKGNDRLDVTAIKNIDSLKEYGTAIVKKQLKRKVTIQSGNYTPSKTDEVIVFTQDSTLNLPKATGSGQHYYIRTIHATVTITNGTDTINEEIQQTIYSGDSVQLIDENYNQWGVY